MSGSVGEKGLRWTTPGQCDESDDADYNKLITDELGRDVGENHRHSMSWKLCHSHIQLNEPIKLYTVSRINAKGNTEIIFRPRNAAISLPEEPTLVPRSTQGIG